MGSKSHRSYTDRKSIRASQGMVKQERADHFSLARTLSAPRTRSVHDPTQVPHNRRCRPLPKETAMTSTMTPLDTPRETTTDAIRPFRLHASDEDLADLRQRIKATRWPEKEPVADFSQGVPLATMQKLARYWTTEYDWRKVEAKLNSYPQFITEIDGLDIHFVHVRSKEKNALPVIVTHGWPGSIIEQLKIIDPLTNPTAHGRGKAPVRDARPFIQDHSHPVLHGVAPANAVRHRGFTNRCGSLAARPRPAQFAAHRTCF